jgi:hypothetical protein
MLCDNNITLRGVRVTVLGLQYLYITTVTASSYRHYIVGCKIKLSKRRCKYGITLRCVRKTVVAVE